MRHSFDGFHGSMSDSDKNSEVSATPKEDQNEQLNENIVDSLSPTIEYSSNVINNGCYSAQDGGSCRNHDIQVATAMEPKEYNDKSCDANTISSNGEPYSVFPRSTRIFIVTMASICCFVSPLSANIYFPALNPLAADLHVSPSLINVSVTTS